MSESSLFYSVCLHVHVCWTTFGGDKSLREAFVWNLPSDLIVIKPWSLTENIVLYFGNMTKWTIFGFLGLQKSKL